MKKNKENLLKKVLKSENGVRFLNFKDKPNLYSRILTIPEAHNKLEVKQDDNNDSVLSIKKLSDKLDNFIRTYKNSKKLTINNQAYPQKIMKMMKVENILKNQNKNNYIKNTVNKSSFIKNNANDIMNKSYFIDKTNKTNYNTTNNQEQIENPIKNMNYELLTKNITNVINKNKNMVKIPMFHNGGAVIQEQPALVGGAKDDSGKLEPEIIAPQSNIMEMLEGLGSNILSKITGFLDLEPAKENPSSVASVAMGENTQLTQQLQVQPPQIIPPSKSSLSQNNSNNNQRTRNNSSSSIGSGKAFLSSSARLPAWRTTLG